LDDEWVQLDFSRAHKFQNHFPCPSILHTSQEARKEGLKFYVLDPVLGLGDKITYLGVKITLSMPLTIYITRASDVIFVMPVRHSRLQYNFMGRIGAHPLKKLRYVAYNLFNRDPNSWRLLAGWMGLEKVMFYTAYLPLQYRSDAPFTLEFLNLGGDFEKAMADGRLSRDVESKELFKAHLDALKALAVKVKEQGQSRKFPDIEILHVNKVEIMRVNGKEA